MNTVPSPSPNGALIATSVYKTQQKIEGSSEQR